MSKSRWQEYKDKNGVTPLDMLNPNTKHVSEDVAKQRFDSFRDKIKEQGNEREIFE
jgi:hypothetical protein